MISSAPVTIRSTGSATCGTFVDQALHHSRPPDPMVGVAGRVDLAAARAGHEVAHVLEAAPSPLDRKHLLADGVPGHACRVAESAEDQVRRTLVVGGELRLDVVVDRRCDAAHEARAHVHGIGAEGEGGDEPACVGMPPEAMIGIETRSAVAGISTRPAMSSSPGCPAHFSPSMEIASTPRRSAFRAWGTLVHLWITLTPQARSSARPTACMPPQRDRVSDLEQLGETSLHCGPPPDYRGLAEEDTLCIMLNQGPRVRSDGGAPLEERWQPVWSGTSSPAIRGRRGRGFLLSPPPAPPPHASAMATGVPR